MTNKKSQKGGDNSTNVQADSLNISLGLSHGEIKQLIKDELESNANEPSVASEGPIRFYSSDLLRLISNIGDVLDDDGDLAEARYDFSLLGLEQKNEINKLGADYFEMIKQHHEPYFYRIENFLNNPINSPQRDKYFDIVDEIRSQIATHGSEYQSFEMILCALKLALTKKLPEDSAGSVRIINIFLSFMYFTCDIGKKQ